MQDLKLIAEALTKSNWFKQSIVLNEKKDLDVVKEAVGGLEIAIGKNHTFDQKKQKATPNKDFDAIVVKRLDNGAVYVTNIPKNTKGMENMKKIDIRSKEEIESRPRTNPEEYIYVEMQELSQNPEKYISKDEKVFLYCASGMRAGRLASELEIEGYDVANGGGIN